MRKLIEKLIQLLEEYKKDNDSPDLGFVPNLFVRPARRMVRSYTTDLDIKKKKLEASKKLKEFLTEILDVKKNPNLDLALVCKVHERVKQAIDEAKEIRKEKEPGGYDRALDTCNYAIDRALYYYMFTGLKNAKEEELSSDPRFIVENYLLYYLIDYEIMKKNHSAPKAIMTRLFGIFGAWGDNEVPLAEKLAVEIQEFLLKIDLNCKNIDKNKDPLLYAEKIKSVLHEEIDKCSQMKLEINPLKTLLLEAKAQIEKLNSNNKISNESLAVELKKKADESTVAVRSLLEKRIDDKKKEDEQRRKEEMELKQKNDELARKQKEEELRKAQEALNQNKAGEAKPQGDVKPKEEPKPKVDEQSLRRASAEEKEKKRIEEARRRAEEEKQKALEEAERNRVEEARKKAEEARLRAEEEARRRAAEEEARRKAEEEAKAEEARKRKIKKDIELAEKRLGRLQ